MLDSLQSLQRVGATIWSPHLRQTRILSYGLEVRRQLPRGFARSLLALLPLRRCVWTEKVRFLRNYDVVFRCELSQPGQADIAPRSDDIGPDSNRNWWEICLVHM